MSKIPLNLIETFLTFADSPHIVEAAHRLTLSQPTVSYQLRQLEEQVGLPLFRQQGRKKVLTSYGEQLKTNLKAEFGQMDTAITNALKKLHNADSPTIRIGARREILNQVNIPHKWKGILRFEAMSSEEAIRRLSNGQLDMAITRKIPKTGDLIQKKFLVSKTVLAIHKKSLQGRSIKSLVTDTDFFKKTPCWAYNDEAPHLKEWIEHLGLKLTDLKIKAYCEDWLVLSHWLEQNEGYLFMPSGIAQKSPHVEIMPMDHRLFPPTVFFAVFRPELKAVPGFDQLIF